MSPAFTPPMLGIPEISDDQWDVLWDAHTRYFVAKGLADVDVDGEPLVEADMAAQDKHENADLLAPAYVDDASIIEFMVRVSGMPKALCAAFTYLDHVEMTRQGAQPECVLQECYQDALEMIQGEEGGANGI